MPCFFAYRFGSWSVFVSSVSSPMGEEPSHLQLFFVLDQHFLYLRGSSANLVRSGGGANHQVRAAGLRKRPTHHSTLIFCCCWVPFFSRLGYLSPLDFPSFSTPSQSQPSPSQAPPSLTYSSAIFNMKHHRGHNRRSKKGD